MPEFAVVDSPVDETLRLPLRCRDGQVRTYTIEPCTARDLIRMQALQESAVAVLADRRINKRDAKTLEDMDLTASELVFGVQVARQMLDDDVLAPEMQRAASAALFWHTSSGDTELAQAVWEGKGRAPKEKTP